MSEVIVRSLHRTRGLQTGGMADACANQAIEWCWIDVLHPDEETMRELERRYGLHPLAIEDSIHPQLRPKIDADGPTFFLVWLTPFYGEAGELRTREIDVFMGDGYLITVHYEPLKAIDAAAAEAARIMSRGQDWLLHAIIDHMVDSVLPVVDKLGDDLDDVEDSMLGEPRRSELAKLYTIRRQLVALRRIVGPERDLLRSLARERDVLSEAAYRYFQDIGDHLARVEDSIETYREVAAAVMDIYLSAQSNRMNEIMKALTVVATIFMPLTLISGIYGMNVVRGMWPPVGSLWSFWAVCGGMAAIALAMSVYFRRKNWW